MQGEGWICARAIIFFESVLCLDKIFFLLQELLPLHNTLLFPWGSVHASPYPAELPPQALPFGFTFTDFSQHNMFPRGPLGGNMEAEILREPWEDLEVPQEPYELVSHQLRPDRTG